MTPKNENQLAEVIAGASGPLCIKGGGTKPVGGPVDGTEVSASAITGVSLYEPGALTLVAAAGTPLAEVESLLAENRQQLPFEPMDYRGLLGTKGEPTLGGIAAANVSGPRRVAVGACRDFMIGVRFVDGRGRVVRNGGRVMKNVTGYDLVKLLAGSRGTLGVLTEIAFKVLPVAEFRAVLLVEDLTDRNAIEALSAALCSPCDVSGAAHLQKGMDGNPVTMIRLEGFENAVLDRAEKLRKALRSFGDFEIETDQDRTAAGWRWIRDVESFQERQGDVWRISTVPGEAPDLVERINGNGDLEFIYDWGGGLIWALVPEGVDLRARAGAFRGHATLVRASDETRRKISVFHPESERVARISKSLKRQFDPREILNPGLTVLPLAQEGGNANQIQ